MSNILIDELREKVKGNLIVLIHWKKCYHCVELMKHEGIWKQFVEFVKGYSKDIHVVDIEIGILTEEAKSILKDNPHSFPHIYAIKKEDHQGKFEGERNIDTLKSWVHQVFPVTKKVGDDQNALKKTQAKKRRSGRRETKGRKGRKRTKGRKEM